jgi:hypothetical protein
MTVDNLTTFLDNCVALTWDSRTARENAPAGTKYSYASFYDQLEILAENPSQKNGSKKVQIMYDVITKKMQADKIDPIRLNDIGNMVLNSCGLAMDENSRKVNISKLHQELKSIAPQDFTFGARLKRSLG